MVCVGNWLVLIGPADVCVVFSGLVAVVLLVFVVDHALLSFDIP